MNISVTNNGLFTIITNWLIKTTGLSKMKVVLMWVTLYFAVSIAAMTGVATRFDVPFWIVFLVCALCSCTFSFKPEAGVEKEWGLIPRPLRIYVELTLWFIGGIQYLEQDTMTWLGVLIMIWLSMNVVDKMFFGKEKPDTLM